MSVRVRGYASPRRRMAELAAAVASAHFVLAFNKGLLVPLMILSLGAVALDAVYALEALVSTAAFVPTAYILDVALKGFRRRKALAYGGLGALASAMLLVRALSMRCWLCVCLSYSMLLLSALVVSVASYSLVVDLFAERAQREAAAALCSFSMFVGNLFGLLAASVLVVHTSIEGLPGLAATTMLIPVSVLVALSQELDEPYYRVRRMGVREYWSSALEAGGLELLAAVALAYAVLGLAIASSPRVLAGAPPRTALVCVALTSLVFNVAAVASGLSQALYARLLAARLGLPGLGVAGLLVYGLALAALPLARSLEAVAALAFVSGLGAPVAVTALVTYISEASSPSPERAARLFSAFYAASSLGYALSLAVVKASEALGVPIAVPSATAFALAAAALAYKPLRAVLGRGAGS